MTIKTFYDISTETQTYPTSDRSILSAIEESRAMYQTWSNNQVLDLGSTRVQLLDAEAPVLKFQIQGKKLVVDGGYQLIRTNQIVVDRREFEQNLGIVVAGK